MYLSKKPLPCNFTVPEHESSAKPLTTVVVCTRDSAALFDLPRTAFISALDFISTCPMSCEHRFIQDDLLVTITQVDTSGKSQNKREYNIRDISQYHHIILNFPNLLLIRLSISRII